MLKNYVQMLKREFKGYNIKSLGSDMISGITVAAVALPLALAFGVSSGADAAAGLITAIIAGVVISLLSGASFQISGPTGAMTAILIPLVSKYGLQGVFVVSVMAGIILLALGLFKLGKLTNMIPFPVITGFTSGIAIIIALGQIDNLFGTTSVGDTAIKKLFSYINLGFSPNWFAVLTGFIVIAVMVVWPKKWNEKVPSSLVGIIVAYIISKSFGFDVVTVGEIPKTLLPEVRLDLTAVNLADISNLISPALTVAALAMIESLLCGASAAQMTGGDFDANQELIAQGIGNILIPFFGGVPATAAIARTSVAVKSGSKTRLTGVFHALGLLASMFLLSDIMSQLPLSALAGVLIVTAWRMNEWASIKNIFKGGFREAIAQYLITMICTVVFDLTVAIIAGVAFAIVFVVYKSTKLSINFSKISNKKLRGSDKNVESGHENSIVVYITGAVYFLNVEKISEKLKEVEGCDEIIFSLRGVPLVDYVGATTIVHIIEEYTNNGTRVYMCGVQDNVMDTLVKCGLHDALVPDSIYKSVDRALLAEA